MGFIDRKALVAEHEYLKKRLAAVEVLLQDGEGAPEAVPKVPRTRRTTNGRSGLRPAIRGVLAQGPIGGMKPIQVTKVLEKRGFDLSGSKTRLSLRVSNDLHRMTGAGQLRRTAGGRYRLANKDGQD